MAKTIVWSDIWLHTRTKSWTALVTWVEHKTAHSSTYHPKGRKKKKNVFTCSVYVYAYIHMCIYMYCGFRSSYNSQWKCKSDHKLCCEWRLAIWNLLITWLPFNPWCCKNFGNLNTCAYTWMSVHVHVGCMSVYVCTYVSKRETYALATTKTANSIMHLITRVVNTTTTATFEHPINETARCANIPWLAYVPIYSSLQHNVCSHLTKLTFSLSTFMSSLMRLHHVTMWSNAVVIYLNNQW